MQSLDDYLDRAKVAQNLASDRQLSLALGKTGGVVNQWRTKRSWPDDDTMAAIADMIGADHDLALVHLNAWRAKGRARTIYAALVQKMSAAILLICAAFPANSFGTSLEQTANLCRLLFIMENI